MRARTRFLLDIALMIAFVAAYRPTWTGFTFHEWLSIAIIVPLLLHVVVNWDWALRILRTFVERLLHASRLNFVVDTALLVSTVAVMLSGLMVSPELVAPLGIKPSNPLAWHHVHLWSANATILLLALHGMLHWRWIVATAKRLAETPARTRTRGATVVAASSERRGAAASARTAVTAADASPMRRSRIGSRAAEAAAERAMAFRTLSVLGVTGALGLTIFAGVGMASPLLAPASQAHQVATATAGQVCPKTGCSASTCHGTTHADPNVFYAHKKLATKAPAKKRRRALPLSRTSSIRVASTPSAVSRSSVSSASGASHKTRAVATKRVAAAKPVTRRSATVTRARMRCPQTGCTASSCHGAHHQSASSYYN